MNKGTAYKSYNANCMQVGQANLLFTTSDTVVFDRYKMYHLMYTYFQRLTK